MTAHTFARHQGDASTYTIRDGAGAVALARTAGTIAVDIETGGLGELQWDIRAVSIGTANAAHVLHPVDDREAIRDCLRAATTLVFHNSPFDCPVLVGHGLMLRRDVSKVYDTLVASRQASPNDRSGRSLGQACERHLGPGYATAKRSMEDSFRALTGKSKAEAFRAGTLDSEVYAAYACFDPVMTARLYAALPAAIATYTADHPFKTSGDPAYLSEREQTVNRMLLAQSCKGIRIDFDAVDDLKGEMALDIARCDASLYSYGIDTTLAPDKLKRAAVAELARLGKLPVNHRKLLDGTYSASANLLDRIEHPIVEALRSRSMAERFSRDYADKLTRLAHDGRIHPQIAIAAATTGRMSYGSPPLQQLPAKTRRMMAFDAPATSMDWSSIEPVYFANVAGEVGMIEHFEAGGDLYQPIADAAGVERSVAKTTLLAQIYGQGVAGLAARLGRDEESVAELVEGIMSRMPRIRAAMKGIRNVGDSFGKIQTMSGRLIPIDPDPRSGNTRFLGYKGVNFVVQGSCYDLLAEVLFELHRRGLDDAVYTAVHDELVVATEVADEVEAIMATPPDAFCRQSKRVPVLRCGRVDLGSHWIAKKS